MHLHQRCLERGITQTNPFALAKDLKKALKNPDAYGDYIEPVYSDEESVIYRFRVQEGIFYVATRDGYPTTILTQEMIMYHKLRKRSKGRMAQLQNWLDVKEVANLSVKEMKRTGKKFKGRNKRSSFFTKPE